MAITDVWRDAGTGASCGFSGTGSLPAILRALMFGGMMLVHLSDAASCGGASPLHPIAIDRDAAQNGKGIEGKRQKLWHGSEPEADAQNDLLKCCVLIGPEDGQLDSSEISGSERRRLLPGKDGVEHVRAEEGERQDAPDIGTIKR